MITPWGHYEPNVMFFGHTNSPAIWTRIARKAMKSCLGKGVEIYMDDIIIYANDAAEMLTLLKEVFECLRKSNIKLHPDKC